VQWWEGRRVVVVVVVVVVVGMHQPLVEEASAPEIYVEDIDRWGVWLVS
jgi:hypothetical protein